MLAQAKGGRFWMGWSKLERPSPSRSEPFLNVRHRAVLNVRHRAVPSRSAPKFAERPYGSLKRSNCPCAGSQTSTIPFCTATQ